MRYKNIMCVFEEKTHEVIIFYRAGKTGKIVIKSITNLYIFILSIDLILKLAVLTPGIPRLSSGHLNGFLVYYIFFFVLSLKINQLRTVVVVNIFIRYRIFGF